MSKPSRTTAALDGAVRAVIYARYSSENQREASIEDQVRTCKARIETEGWNLAATYTDYAQSGASHPRPGYQKLLADGRVGAFDVVVAEALDRLSRDQERVAALFKHLSFVGVKIITLAEGEIGALHVGLKGTMNALYLTDLRQKVWRGLEGRVRQGRSGGGVCYGYDVVRELDTRSEPVCGKRVIDQAEAPVVRRIFEAFAAGRPPRAIARELNIESVPGPGGRPWSDTTIRGHAPVAAPAKNRKGIRRTVLEGLIINALKHNLMHADLVAEFIREFHAEINRQRREAELSLGLKRRQLEEARRKLDGLIEAIAEGFRTPGLQARLEELERYKARLEDEIALTPKAAPRLHPNLADLYRKKVTNLQEALADPGTRMEALEILRSMIECVRVKTAENGVEIELIGEIANMVRLSAGWEGLEKEPYRSSVKVVAGVGFEPTTFRL